MPRMHELDPQGDVLLILESPNAPFAVWSENEEWLAPLPETCPPPRKYNQRSSYKLFSALDNGSYSSQNSYEEEPPATMDEPVDGQVATETEEPTIGIPNDDYVPLEEEEVHLLLSSKHLILASPCFKKMLKGPWAEASVVDNVFHVKATNWDTEALLILMNVIHCRFRSVPRSVSVEMLAKIAVLVDYYECHEAVEFMSDTWLENLEHPIPTELTRDLVLWLTITFVFNKNKEFQTVTKTIIPLVRGPLQKLGLPIPASITDQIENTRQEIIDKVLDFLHGLVQYLRDDRSRCSFECSCALLGALIKGMQSNSILSPQIPLLGCSIADTVNILRQFRSPEIYSYKRRTSPCSCSIRQFTDPYISTLEEDLKGLKLAQDKE